jgi:hypothetical protein
MNRREEIEKALLDLGRDPSCGGNWFLRYPCLKNFFHNWLITNDLKSTKA